MRTVLQSFFRRGHWPIYIPALLSVIGTLFYLIFSHTAGFDRLLSDRWSLLYLLTTPFIHGGLAHLLFNVLALEFIGGQMLLPVIGRRYFMILFISAMLVAGVINNIFSDYPAIGISGGILALLGCSLYPFGKVPMKFLLIHDLLRLPPFPLYAVVGFVVALDIVGIIFDWRFFAHWAHLFGFICGIIGGFYIFIIRPRQRTR